MNAMQRILISEMESIDRCYMWLYMMAELQELAELMTMEDIRNLKKIMEVNEL